ncbi:MAG: hypothetical protein NZ870_04900 [bacterium]|nr:hypothetical protein [bacterium]
MDKKLNFTVILILTILVFSCVKQQSVDNTLLQTPSKLVGRPPTLVDGKFYVYKNSSDRSFYAPSGWMGDYGDIKMDTNCKDNPKSEPTCIKFTYTAKGSQGAGWAGVYWQNPANNWGSLDGGYNLVGAKKLTFWARGEKGGEVISDFKMGGIFQGEYPDSGSASIGTIVLTKEWKQYTINLKGVDLSYIIGGFCWVATKNDNPSGMTFYLDDIQYEFE